MKLEDLKGQKLMEPIFFRKMLALGKKPKISSTAGIFYFCLKFYPFIFLFFFTQKWFMKVFFVILQKAHVLKKTGSKMLSANHIAVFFDHQYL